MSHTAQAAQTLDWEVSPDSIRIRLGSFDGEYWRTSYYILTLLLFAQGISDWHGFRKSRVSWMPRRHGNCQDSQLTLRLGPGMESMNPSHGWGLASCPKQWAVKLNGINTLTKCFVVFFRIAYVCWLFEGVHCQREGMVYGRRFEPPLWITLLLPLELCSWRGRETVLVRGFKWL